MRRRFVYITGHGRHGKDTVADMMARYGGYRPCDSSKFVCQRAVFPCMTDMYDTWEECYADRHNHRQTWYDLISIHNDVGHELSVELFKEHDVYTGLRSKRELDAFKNLFPDDTFVIWVDGSDRLPPEPATSISITQEDADWVIDNNGTEEELTAKVADLLMILSYDMAYRHYKEKNNERPSR